ncbi:phosphomannomutase CpsG [Salmonella enterica]|nr:phosphomannomutase CpsG [Salmonella enterica]
MTKLTCFKAYDIRGRLGEELNEDIAWRIGRAYGEYLKPKTVVLGGDVRLTSEALKLALAKGLQDAGVDVLDIGMSGTEEIYFATFHLGVDGGIEVTASHNPMDYNGMKLVREGARPISGDTGLRDVQRLAEAGDFPPVNEAARGSYRQISLRDAYIDHLLGYISVNNLTPLKLVVNSGNGAAGPVIDAIEARLEALGAPVEFIKIHNTPDGTFPNGIPNPLLPECRDDTRKAVIEHGADMGIAFDGDFDRCFLFDEKGQFIEGYYIVGLLAEAFLEKHPGAKIIHDPRLTWNTEAVVTAAGGTPVMSKTGHAFIKERMRTEDAIYGGEMSAHHYFRDFAYCDSGMIPWLLVAELVCLKGQSLGELVRDRMAAFPASGEINSRLAEPAAAMARVEAHFAEEAQAVDRTDGLSMSFANYVSYCMLKASQLKADYIYISKTTKRVIDSIELFKNCKGYYFPNTFFRFEEIAKKNTILDLGYILLVTGVGDNKDLDGALKLYSSISKDERLPLKILGCGNAIERVKKIIDDHRVQSEIEVIPFLDLDDVVSLYCNSTFIWAHSKYEGYGRAVAEAKLSHKKILCTQISAFMEQKDENVYLYTNQNDFHIQYKAVLASKYKDIHGQLIEHEIFKSQLEFLYGKK